MKKLRNTAAVLIAALCALVLPASVFADLIDPGPFGRDSSRIWLIILIIAAAAAVVLILILRNRKKRK